MCLIMSSFVYLGLTLGFGFVIGTAQSQEPKSKFRDAFNSTQKVQGFNPNGTIFLNIPEIKYVGTIYNKPGNKKPGPNEEDERVHWKVPELIKGSGNFDVETHNVTTADGYILTVFRIVNLGCEMHPDVPPVYFQHGISGTAADFLLLDPEFALPFILAENGHDVWLGNSRGNEYSMGHVNMSSKDPKYWRFSFHEMGLFDLPAVFVGHGMGTTIFYVCVSLDPKKWNYRIKTMIGFGPTAYMSRSVSTFRALTPLVQLYKSKLIPDGPTLPSSLSSYLHLVVPEICYIKKHNLSLCAPAIFFTGGDDRVIVEDTRTLARIFGHLPSTTSVKTLVHYLQLFETNTFRQFDYGVVKNFIEYNQTVPPKYNIFQIEILSVNYYGQEDTLLERTDAEQTVSELGTSDSKFNILLTELGSMDFIYDETLGLVNFENIIRYLERLPDLQSGPKVGLKEEYCICQGRCRQSQSYFSKFL